MSDVDAAATLQALASNDPALRGAALVELEAGVRDLDEAVVTRTIELLADPSKEVRRRAAGALARAANVEAFECRIRAALGDPDRERRWGAAFALARGGCTGRDVLAVALEAMGAGDGDVRWSAAEIATSYARSDSRAMDAVRALASGTEPNARKMGLYCLRDLDREATDVFVAALDDDSAGVRLAALAGLMRALAPGPAVVARVVACLEDDVDAGVRRAAATTLGRIMGESAFALAALRKAAADENDQDLARAASGALTRGLR